MKTCTKCGEVKSPSDFHANPRNRSGLQSNCKVCQRQNAKRWRESNKHRIAEYNTAYRTLNAEAIAVQERLYRANNQEKFRAKERRRRERDPVGSLMKTKKRKAAARQAEPRWADQTIIAFIYATRLYLTQDTGEEWHVDHVVPLRGANVCGLHVHYNLRLVPAKLNMVKGNRFPFTY